MPDRFGEGRQTDLSAKAIWSLVILIAIMGAILFGSAGTLRYGEAWTFLALYGALALAITVYLVKRDPRLLARRIKAGPLAEKEPSQKIVQLITGAAFVAMLVVSALDHRWHWSTMPVALVVIGDLAVALGFYVIFVVYRENGFASAIIETDPEQTVVSTGPYALVRHPMYGGGVLMFAGIPLALASWWGLLPVLSMLPAIIWRPLDEERFLALRLPGYADYRTNVRYRLVPRIW